MHRADEHLSRKAAPVAAGNVAAASRRDMMMLCAAPLLLALPAPAIAHDVHNMDVIYPAGVGSADPALAAYADYRAVEAQWDGREDDEAEARWQAAWEAAGQRLAQARATTPAGLAAKLKVVLDFAMNSALADALMADVIAVLEGGAGAAGRGAAA